MAEELVSYHVPLAEFDADGNLISAEVQMLHYDWIEVVGDPDFPDGGYFFPMAGKRYRLLPEGAVKRERDGVREEPVSTRVDSLAALHEAVKADIVTVYADETRLRPVDETKPLREQRQRDGGGGGTR